MNKLLLVIIVLICCLGVSNAQNAQITRQGGITFFSYTSVEDIKADNNQVLSLFYPQTKKIGVEILMRAFTFEKSLMYEHFNESYIESDLYPKAIFQGEVVDFDFDQKGEQTRLIKGSFTLRDITIPVEFKGKILEVNGAYVINGSLGLAVDDFNIRIPALLAPNIAKNIQVSFNFEYMPYDDQK